VDPHADAEDVARILEQDVAMSAKLLQLVNSSFFASAMPITSVKFAVVRLGFQMMKNLAMSLEVFKSRALPRVQGFSMDHLQQHSFLVASVVNRLINDRQQSEDAFMAGMLHDIGQLIMATELPEKLEKAIEVAKAESLPLHVAEEKLYGVTHAEVGAYLLGIWGLPYPIVEAVANHHHPSRVPPHDFGILDAVHIAECLISEVEDDEKASSPLNLDYLEALGVMDKVASWRKMVPELMESSLKGTSK